MMRQVPRRNQWQWERMIDAYIKERQMIAYGVSLMANLLAETGRAQKPMQLLMDMLLPGGPSSEEFAEKMLKERGEIFEEQMSKPIRVTGAAARLDLSSLLE